MKLSEYVNLIIKYKGIDAWKELSNTKAYDVYSADLEMQKVWIRINPVHIDYINNPSKELIDLALEKGHKFENDEHMDNYMKSKPIEEFVKSPDCGWYMLGCLLKLIEKDELDDNIYQPGKNEYKERVIRFLEKLI